ncbi:HEAT repeat domain-containing protein [Candidatus Micrarchaeota archaeon]|nr:HEAT repeat domain-containing protein [Candidatus Micrarchaeota archaeon]
MAKFAEKHPTLANGLSIAKSVVMKGFPFLARQSALLVEDVRTASDDTNSRDRFLRALFAGAIGYAAITGTCSKITDVVRPSNPSWTTFAPASSGSDSESVDLVSGRSNRSPFETQPFACTNIPNPVSGVPRQVHDRIMEIKMPPTPGTPIVVSRDRQYLGVLDSLESELTVQLHTWNSAQLARRSDHVGSTTGLPTSPEFPILFGAINGGYPCLRTALLRYQGATMPPEVRADSLSILRYVRPNDNEVFPYFNAALSSNDPNIRAIGLDAIIRMHPAGFINTVRAHLNDPSEEVRHISVDFLGERWDMSAVPWLQMKLTASARDTDHLLNEYRDAIHSIFGRAEADHLAEFIRRTNGNEDVEVQALRSSAFDELNDPRFIPINDPNDQARNAMVARVRPLIPLETNQRLKHEMECFVNLDAPGCDS